MPSLLTPASTRLTTRPILTICRHAHTKRTPLPRQPKPDHKYSPSRPSKAQPPPRASPTPPHPPPPGPPSPRSPGIQSYTTPRTHLLTHLSTQETPTTLFLASSSNAHQVASFALSTFCIAYGTYNFYDSVLTPHPGLWVAIPVFMGGVCAAMVGGGAYVGLSARRLVARIEALPASSSSSFASTSSAASSSVSSSPLQIRIEGKKILPFGKPKTRVVSVDQIRLLDGRVEDVLRGTDGITGRRLTEGEVRERVVRESERGGVLGGISRGLGAFGRVVSRDGFVRMKVGNEVWRVDVRGGSVAGGMVDRLFAP